MVINNLEIDELIEMFERVNEIFLREQGEFICSGVSERSWYTPMAILFYEEIKKNLPEYYVDTEYNRNKSNNSGLKTIKNGEGRVINVTCDLIIHSRGNIKEQDNLICMEMKKSYASNKSKQHDKERLEYLTKDTFDNIWSYDGKTLPKHVCRYKLGIYYEINIRKKTFYIEYYRRGEKINEYSLKF